MNFKSFIVSALATMLLSCPMAAKADLLGGRTPYLQNLSPDGVTIMYQTDALCHSVVEYGTDTTTTLTSARQLLAGQEVVHDRCHQVRLDGLAPGAKYFYRIRAKEITENQAYHKTFGAEELTPFYSFTVPAEHADDFTVLVVNDLHGVRATIDAMSRLAATTPHDLIVFNGDCLSEPASEQAAIADLHYMVAAFDLANNPGLFIRGNHEIRNAWSSGAHKLFDRPGGHTYGAFTLADIRFICLDCGEDKPDSTWVYYGLNDFNDLRNEQVDFLRKELKSKDFHQAKRRIMIHHIPIWGNCDKYSPCTELWSPVLSNAKIDLDIAGHTHSFAVHEAGTIGNPALTIVGGAPETARATMTIVRKHGKALTATVVDASGNTLAKFDL